jgi:hypothetical protein
MTSNTSLFQVVHAGYVGILPSSHRKADKKYRNRKRVSLAAHGEAFTAFLQIKLLRHVWLSLPDTHSKLLSSKRDDEECDARDDDSGTGAGPKKHLLQAFAFSSYHPIFAAPNLYSQILC